MSEFDEQAIGESIGDNAAIHPAQSAVPMNDFASVVQSFPTVHTNIDMSGDTDHASPLQRNKKRIINKIVLDPKKLQQLGLDVKIAQALSKHKNQAAVPTAIAATLEAVPPTDSTAPALYGTAVRHILPVKSSATVSPTLTAVAISSAPLNVATTTTTVPFAALECHSVRSAATEPKVLSVETKRLAPVKILSNGPSMVGESRLAYAKKVLHKILVEKTEAAAPSAPYASPQSPTLQPQLSHLPVKPKPPSDYDPQGKAKSSYPESTSIGMRTFNAAQTPQLKSQAEVIVNPHSCTRTTSIKKSRPPDDDIDDSNVVRRVHVAYQKLLSNKQVKIKPIAGMQQGQAAFAAEQETLTSVEPPVCRSIIGEISRTKIPESAANTHQLSSQDSRATIQFPGKSQHQLKRVSSNNVSRPSCSTYRTASVLDTLLSDRTAYGASSNGEIPKASIRTKSTLQTENSPRKRAFTDITVLEVKKLSQSEMIDVANLRFPNQKNQAIKTPTLVPTPLMSQSNAERSTGVPLHSPVSLKQSKKMTQVILSADKLKKNPTEMAALAKKVQLEALKKANQNCQHTSKGASGPPIVVSTNADSRAHPRLLINSTVTKKEPFTVRSIVRAAQTEGFVIKTVTTTRDKESQQPLSDSFHHSLNLNSHPPKAYIPSPVLQSLSKSTPQFMTADLQIGNIITIPPGAQIVKPKIVAANLRAAVLTDLPVGSAIGNGTAVEEIPLIPKLTEVDEFADGQVVSSSADERADEPAVLEPAVKSCDVASTSLARLKSIAPLVELNATPSADECPVFFEVSKEIDASRTRADSQFATHTDQQLGTETLAVTTKEQTLPDIVPDSLQESKEALPCSEHFSESDAYLSDTKSVHEKSTGVISEESSVTSIAQCQPNERTAPKSIEQDDCSKSQLENTTDNTMAKKRVSRFKKGVVNLVPRRKTSSLAGLSPKRAGCNDDYSARAAFKSSMEHRKTAVGGSEGSTEPTVIEAVTTKLNEESTEVDDVIQLGKVICPAEFLNSLRPSSPIPDKICSPVAANDDRTVCQKQNELTVINQVTVEKQEVDDYRVPKVSTGQEHIAYAMLSGNLQGCLESCSGDRIIQTIVGKTKSAAKTFSSPTEPSSLEVKLKIANPPDPHTHSMDKMMMLLSVVPSAESSLPCGSVEGSKSRNPFKRRSRQSPIPAVIKQTKKLHQLDITNFTEPAKRSGSKELQSTEAWPTTDNSRLPCDMSCMSVGEYSITSVDKSGTNSMQDGVSFKHVENKSVGTRHCVADSEVQCTDKCSYPAAQEKCNAIRDTTGNAMQQAAITSPTKSDNAIMLIRGQSNRRNVPPKKRWDPLRQEPGTTEETDITDDTSPADDDDDELNEAMQTARLKWRLGTEEHAVEGKARKRSELSTDSDSETVPTTAVDRLTELPPPKHLPCESGMRRKGRKSRKMVNDDTQKETSRPTSIDMERTLNKQDLSTAHEKSLGGTVLMDVPQCSESLQHDHTATQSSTLCKILFATSDSSDLRRRERKSRRLGNDDNDIVKDKHTETAQQTSTPVDGNMDRKDPSTAHEIVSSSACPRRGHKMTRFEIPQHQTSLPKKRGRPTRSGPAIEGTSTEVSCLSIPRNVSKTDPSQGGHIQITAAPDEVAARRGVGRPKTTGETIHSFNPRILLIRHRRQLDTDEILTAAPLSSSKHNLPKGMTRCGLCLAETKRTDWLQHLREHYGVGWMEGENELDVTQRGVVLNKMVQFFRDNNVTGGLPCRICLRAYRSALGLLQHVELCGAPPVRVVCEFCQRDFSTLSLRMHVRTCEARPDCSGPAASGVSEPPSSTQDTLNVYGRQKRASLLKAERKLKAIGENILTNLVSDAELKKHIKYIPPFKIDKVSVRKWTRLLKKLGKVSCPHTGCSFTVNTHIDDLTEHASQCEFVLQSGYVCQTCKVGQTAAAIFSTETAALQHIEQKHTVIRKGKQLDFDGDSSECRISGSDTSDSEDTGDDSAAFENLEETASGKVSRRNNVKKPAGRNRKSYAVRELAKKWNSFIEQNYSKHALYPGRGLPMYSSVPLEEVERYLPKQMTSMKFAFSSSTTNCLNLAQESVEWLELPRFGSMDTPNNEHVIFIGGPCKAFAWVPLPTEATSNTQYLLVAYRKYLDKYTRCKEPVVKPTLLLLYAVEKSPNVKSPPHSKLVYAFRVADGPILCLEFLPSGGYDAASNRLGIVAVGSAASSISVYTLPIRLTGTSHLVASGTDRFPLQIVELPVTFVLSIDSPVHLANAHHLLTTQCHNICWSHSAGHQHIFAGFANGCIGIWDITEDDSANINLFADNGVLRFLPLHYFYGGDRILCDMAVHYDTFGPRWMAIAYRSRKMEIYDIRNMTQPRIIRSEYSTNTVRSVDWPVMWEPFALGYCDIFATAGRSYGTHHPLGVTGFWRRFDSMLCSISHVHYNPIQNVMAVAAENGEVLFANMYDVHLDCVPRLTGRVARSFIEARSLTSDERLRTVAAKDLPDDWKMYDPEYQKQIGVVFGPLLKPTEVDKKDYMCDKRIPDWNMLRYVSVSCLRWNMNTAASTLVAIGHDNGLLRIVDVH